MEVLPLFPLNTVLFPGMPLRLRVFEERYHQMIHYCLRTGGVFGVVLIRHGQEAYGALAEPYEIGCSARIVRIEPTYEGHLNLVVFGQERLRIVERYRNGEPFLLAKVEAYPLRLDQTELLLRPLEHLKSQVGRYMQLLARMSDEFKEEALPQDPIAMLYLAAQVLQVPLAQKQACLEAEGAESLVQLLSGLYRRELALMRAFLEESSRKGIGIFSRC